MTIPWWRAWPLVLVLWLPGWRTGAQQVAGQPCETFEQCREQCDAGVATGCSSLGLWYARGVGVTPDSVQAKALFERACHAGEAKGCCNLGVLYARGDGVEADPRRAAQLYNRACDQGDAACCGNAGSALELGRGQPKDVGRAERYYVRACNAGNGPACFSLGRLYESRDAADAGPHSGKRAIDAYERGCRGAHEDSCRRVPPFTLGSEAWLDESFVILTPGQHLLLECELDGRLIRRLRRVATVERPDRTLEVQLAEVPNVGRSFTMLTIKNPFSNGLKYEAAVQLRGTDTFMRTSTLPVRAGLTTYESWPNRMARVVLNDFRLAR